MLFLASFEDELLIHAANANAAIKPVKCPEVKYPTTIGSPVISTVSPEMRTGIVAHKTMK